MEKRLNQREPSYKSEAERRIGRILDRYGIPFFYEQPTIIYDQGRRQIWHPDFTLPTYNALVVEYAGARSTSDRERTIPYRQRVYRANDIPTVFLADADLQGPRWPIDFLERLEYLYRHPGVSYGQPDQPLYETSSHVSRSAGAPDS